MSNDQKNDLLSRLNKLTSPSRKKPAAPSPEVTPESPAPSPAAAQPSTASSEPVADVENNPEIEGLLDRINSLTQTISDEQGPDGNATADAESTDAIPVIEEHEAAVGGVEDETPPAETPRATVATPEIGHDPSEDELFFPAEPQTFREASLTDSQVEELVLKYLLVVGEDTGQGIADQTKLPFQLISDLMHCLKSDQLIAYKGMTSMNDYCCVLSEDGRQRARSYSQKCTYYGAAPVSLKSYCESVSLQSLTHQHPCEEDLKRAFSDLLVNPKMFLRLGAAVNSGRGMFLYGFPGNGKTSIAERITKAFGETIWIPRAIGVGGEIIRVFDPSQHEVMPLPESEGIVRSHKADARWVRIRRPTIIVGGELTMDNLELTTNHATGINEAPIQLKSNCGTLVIDDFGRQRMTTDELLNRWIVPLEKRYDFLNLPSGTKLQVPFDQLVVFSTNLEPKDLVDDAFLRRIPYKIEVENPAESEFRQLFEIMSPKFDIKCSSRALDYLIETHYKPVDRPFRCCHPRDLLLQVKNYCLYRKQTPTLTKETVDFAVANYFAVME